MPTCKECIHNLVCAIYGPELIDIFENGEYCIEYKNEADVVEVVRCRDCIHFYAEKGGFCELHGIEFYSDDYCSYRRRRE